MLMKGLDALASAKLVETLATNLRIRKKQSYAPHTLSGDGLI